MSWMFKDPVVIMKEIMSWLFKDPVVIMKEIMSWLLKDPIVTVAWLTFDCTLSNSKKWPKKIKLPQLSFLLEKELIKFSCKSLVPFIAQNQNNNLKADLNEDVNTILGQYDQIALDKIIFRKTINIISISLLAPFIVQNCKTILSADPILGSEWSHIYIYISRTVK